MDKSLHPSVRNVTVDQTPPFTPEEIKKFYSDRIIVDGEYILRGQFDEELNVHDFYFTPDQIHLVMELLHDRVMSDPDPDMGEENDLLQELTCQTIHHPDGSMSDLRHDESVGDRNCSHDGCTDKIFDSYKDYPLCKPHYDEHIDLQKMLSRLPKSLPSTP